MSENTENMELIPIMECSQQAIIKENLHDLRDRISVISTEVAALPREKGSVQLVKKRRTEMRQYFEELDSQRKAVKRAVLAPYEQAMELYKDLVQGPLEALDIELKGFIDEVEAKAKQECEETLRAYFAEKCQQIGIKWLTYEQMGIKVNMTIANQKTPKKAMEYIDTTLARIYNDLLVISNMENYNDIMGYYVKTLDLANSIDAANQQKARKEQAEQIQRDMEQRRQQEEEHRQQIIEQAPEIQQIPVKQEQEEVYEMGFAVRGTLDQLRAVKAFLVGNHYDFNNLEVK